MFFAIFLSLDHKFFSEIEYDDSLLQRLTSSRGKTYEKKIWGPKFEPNGPKSRPKLGFLPFPQVLFSSFPLNCMGWSFDDRCLTTSRRGKTHKKIWGSKIVPDTWFFAIFSSLHHYYYYFFWLYRIAAWDNV